MFWRMRFGGLRLSVVVLTVALVVVGCAPPTQTGPAAPPTASGASSSNAPAAAASPAASKPAAPAPAAAAPSAGGSRVLRIGSVADVTSLHPARQAIGTDRMMVAMVYSNLVRFKLGGNEILPDLAETWEKSADGKTYTFHLRKGVQFHKGYGELTSSDVKFTIEYYQDKDKSAKSRQASLFEVVERVETPDPYTAVIKLSTPFIGFMETLAWQNGFIVSEKAVKALGEDLEFQPVGTGPFEFSSWSKGQEIVFTRFPQYFGEPARVAEVRVRVIPDQSTQILAVSRGELDGVNINSIPALKIARATPGLQILEQRGTNVTTLRLNTKAGPTANLKVRQALAYAIDKQAVSDASAGLLEKSVTMVNPFVFGYTTNVPAYEYDPEKARGLLKEAGYNGEPISILYYTTGPYAELAQITKDAWTQIGVNAQLEQVDASTANSRGAAGKFDAFVIGVARNTPDEYFSVSFRTGGGLNHGGYSNPDVDQLIVQARSQSDEAVGRQMYEKLQQQIMTDLPVIPISTIRGIWAVSPKVKNFTYDTIPAIGGFQFVEIE